GKAAPPVPRLAWRSSTTCTPSITACASTAPSITNHLWTSNNKPIRPNARLPNSMSTKSGHLHALGNALVPAVALPWYDYHVLRRAKQSFENKFLSQVQLGNEERSAISEQGVSLMTARLWR